MNATRDQVMLGLALQNGLINREQALLVKERHQQFFQANRPVSVSAILRALKLVSDQELERLERAVDESGTSPAPAAPPLRPPTAANANPIPVKRAGVATPPSGVPQAQITPRRTSDQSPAAISVVPTLGAVPALPGGQRMLGKYRIIQPLGQGGMGTVYLAEDTHLNRKVALKVLPKELASNREFIKRFLAEARVTGKLSHPNIVVAYDIDSSQGLWFMAMEYLEGESIGARLKRSEPIPWRDALTMLKQICRGLAYAHKVGIVHRDIKPDNLFLDKASGEAKILDMGLSKNLHASENSSLTQAGMILGTPNYLAPEQAENGINVDARADLYSLGATLYHMLAGVPPFDGPTPLSIIQKHLFEPMPDIRKARPDVPVDVANLLWKMTAKKPADRFTDCTELGAAIDNVLEGRGFQLADPMQSSRRGSGGRNPASGSGQRAALHANQHAGSRGTRGTRGVTPIDRKSRSGSNSRSNMPMMIVGTLLIGAVSALIWLALKNNAQQNDPTHTAAQSTPQTPNASTNPAATAPFSGPGQPLSTTQPTGLPALNPGASNPAAASENMALNAVVTSASRGLNLSDQVDRELVDRETQENIKRLMQQNAAAPVSTPGGTTPAATGAELAGARAFTPRSGAPRITHLLTDDEKKRAGTLLESYLGDTVLRVNVPGVLSEEITKANIKIETPDEINKLRVLKLGTPPSQYNPQVYQGVFVEPDPRHPPQGTVNADTRIRFLMKVETGDAQPVEYRLMYSSLPVTNNLLLGGVLDRTHACDWELVDMPVMLYNQHFAEKNWFGYASGVPADFKLERKITLTVSDIIIYNPKE